ncbi:unnamed protein product [Anisakis simplex]|uniref:DUF4440 domain-containing protein n=1 Tax=Anisakis simplex TaxID=6269 RepID=A0A0M3J349_ANISI|nr:unnamed protein product [Anisakis simplex]
MKGIAEIQKLHDDLGALRKAGKYEEALKHCTEDCYFMTPLKSSYSAKEALEVAKNPVVQEYSKADSKVTVDDVKVTGDFAADRGHFVIQKDGEKKGSYLAIWKKDGDSWKLAAICFNFTMEQ